jgi:hypothetical protein
MQEKSAQIVITRAAIECTSSISMTCASTHCHVTTLWLLLAFDYHREKVRTRAYLKWTKEDDTQPGKNASRTHIHNLQLCRRRRQSGGGIAGLLLNLFANPDAST